MNSRSAGISAIRAIVSKDLRLFARDRFYSFISVLTLVMLGALFWVLPADLETSISIGIYLPGGEELLAEGIDDSADEGLDVVVFDSVDALEAAVRAGDEVVAGMAFPPDFLADVAAGRHASAQVFMSGAAPDALRTALAGAVRELTFALIGEEPPFTLTDDNVVILGDDRAAPLALREQMRPLLLFIVLLVEMFALAALVAVEIAQRTAPAILVSAARVSHLLAAKAILGTTLAFSQAMLIALVTGTLARQTTIVVVALLLGAIIVTGLGLLAGALGQDFVAIVFWSMLFFVPMVVPAFAVLFPGTPAMWIQALPSYGLVETLLRAVAYGQGWVDVLPYLAMLAAWCVALFGLGTAVLSRRVARI